MSVSSTLNPCTLLRRHAQLIASRPSRARALLNWGTEHGGGDLYTLVQKIIGIGRFTAVLKHLQAVVVSVSSHSAVLLETVTSSME